MKLARLAGLGLGLALCASLLLAPAARAAGDYEETTPQAIQAEIQRLRVVYTDDHPDIQILKRRLQRALELQEKKKQEKAAQAAGGGAQP